MLRWIKSNWWPVAALSGLMAIIGVSKLPADRPCSGPPEDCSVVRHEAEQPQVIMEVLDPSLDVYAVIWRNEIARRFPHAVGILVHGADLESGRWIVGAPINGHRIQTAADVVKHFQEQYPDRTIVLLACNTGHLKLGVPGVWYAKSSVWCVPDRALTPDMFTSDEATQKLDGSRWEFDPDVVGNIYEFVKE